MQFYPQTITIYALLLQNVLQRFMRCFRKSFNDKKLNLQILSLFGCVPYVSNETNPVEIQNNCLAFWVDSLLKSDPVWRLREGRPTNMKTTLAGGWLEVQSCETRWRGTGSGCCCSSSAAAFLQTESQSSSSSSFSATAAAAGGGGSGGVSTRRQLGPWESFLTADLPPCRPAGCCRKKLLHKSFSSVCLATRRAMRCPPPT